MTDPLSILREYIIGKKTILEKDGMIIFGTYSWPKTVKTNYASLIWQSEKDKTPYEYYTLECLVFLMKHVDLPHPVYCRKAQAENVPYIKRPDRKGLLKYLRGITDTSKSINDLFPTVPPTEVKTEPDEGMDRVYVEESFSIERSSSLSPERSSNSQSENYLEIKTEPKEETNEANMEEHSSGMESTSFSDRNSWSEKIKTEPEEDTNEADMEVNEHSSIVVSSPSENSRNSQSKKSVKSKACSVDDVDTELLIENVKAHPEIWNIYCEDYKERRKRDAAWEKISINVIQNLEEKEEEEKNEIVKRLILRWKNVRDAYFKSMKTRTDSLQPAAKRRQYVHANQLSFLQQLTDLTTAQTAIPKKATIPEKEGGKFPPLYSHESRTSKVVQQPQSTSASNTIPTAGERKRNLENALLKFLKQPIIIQPPDEDQLFFYSLLPTVRKLNEDEKLEFKAEVINILKTLRQSSGSQNTVFQPYPQPQYHFPA